MKIFLLVFAFLNIIGFLWVFNFYDSEGKIHMAITAFFIFIHVFTFLVLPFLISPMKYVENN